MIKYYIYVELDIHIYIYISISIIIIIYIYICICIYIDIMYFPFLATFGIIPPDHNSTFFFWVVHLRNAWNKTMQHTYHTNIPSSYQKLPSKAADIRASSAASSDEQKFTGYSSQQPGTGFRATPNCVSSGSYPILTILSTLSIQSIESVESVESIYLSIDRSIYLPTPIQSILLYSKFI